MNYLLVFTFLMVIFGLYLILRTKQPKTIKLIGKVNNRSLTCIRDYNNPISSVNGWNFFDEYNIKINDLELLDILICALYISNYSNETFFDDSNHKI